MVSKHAHLKARALALRRAGTSMTVVERQLGIPRSTLSGWFKSVTLTEAQRTQLMKNSKDGWQKARPKAHQWHKKQKALRLFEAYESATQTLNSIKVSPEVMDLAFAMLYLGEGAKQGATSIASSDPMILRFVITVLKKNYQLSPTQMKFYLHLRMDQDGDTLKSYWAEALDVALDQFRSVSYDKRSAGKKTFDHYKGVCVLECGNIAIQRKLMYLYTLFCKHISQLCEGD